MWIIIIGSIALIILLAVLYYRLLLALYPEKLRTDEIHTVKTADLWKLRICRYRKPESSGQPVLLVHGINTNHHNFTSPAGACLVDHLVESGFDCWAIDLRGCHSSIPPFERSYRECTLDDYLEYDLPAAMQYVREQSGYQKVHWVGHSMGGMLLYAYAQVHGEMHLASGVTLGSPLGFEGVRAKVPRFMLWLVESCPRLTGIGVRALIPLGKLFRASLPYFPTNMRNIPPQMKVGHFFNMLENPLPEVTLEMVYWLQSQSWQMLDGRVNIKSGLKTMKFPLLALYAPKDPFVPLSTAYQFFQELPHNDKKILVRSKDEGCLYDYNHVDLVFGKNGAQEVYQPIGAWIKDHSNTERYSQENLTAKETEDSSPRTTSADSASAVAESEATTSQEEIAATTEPGTSKTEQPTTAPSAPKAPSPKPGPPSKEETPSKDSPEVNETPHTPSTSVSSPEPTRDSQELKGETTSKLDDETEQAQATTPSTPQEKETTRSGTVASAQEASTPMSTAPDTAPSKHSQDTEKTDKNIDDKRSQKAEKSSAHSTKQHKSGKKIPKNAAELRARAKKHTNSKSAKASTSTDKTPQTSQKDASKSKTKPEKAPSRDKNAQAKKSAVIPKRTKRAIAQAGDLMRAVSEPRKKDADEDKSTNQNPEERKAKDDD